MMDRDDGPNCDHADLVHRANKLLKASGIPTQTNTHMIDSSPTHRLNLMRLFMSAVLGMQIEDVRLTRDEQNQVRHSPETVYAELRSGLRLAEYGAREFLHG